MIRISDEAAFWALGEPQPNGCILWTGRTDDRGYGRMGPGLTGVVHPHRSALILTHGPIPAGLDVEHSCHTRSRCTLGDRCPHRRCINPDHLGLLTRSANCALQHRMTTGKPTCPKGHEKRTLPNGDRYCPTCTSAATKVWLAKDGNREKQNAMRMKRHKAA